MANNPTKPSKPSGPAKPAKPSAAAKPSGPAKPAKLKFPYTMHCPKCKSGLKIKAPNLVGTQIACPHCKKKIYVVTPDEDAMVNYEVEAPPEKEKAPEPTEEEIFERQKIAQKKKQIELLKKVWFWTNITFLVAILGAACWGVYTYAIVPFANEDLSMPEEDSDRKKMPNEFK